jgi:oligopeptidase B
MSNDPGFNRNKLSLIDRGFIFAIAHVRGGGEMGRQWYEDGKYLRKRNTFTDFVAAAEHLVALKYTSPAKLCIEARPLNTPSCRKCSQAAVLWWCVPSGY